ncbi:MAG: alanine--tRNA ligase [Holosporales bacterium]|jgi:alanyl-tRNA synthetase|nr:alanine--tRNA ligase [Holosporales bacterium]
MLASAFTIFFMGHPKLYRPGIVEQEGLAWYTHKMFASFPSKTMVSSVADIRTAFIDFFTKHSHTHVKSSSLVPDNDPTLMFTNSGMVQFKDIFTGKKTMPFKRATTAQKSLRAGGKHNDLENVGYTARHHTFFEMLGNFSFGDYFKENAIEYAWEVVTKVLELPKEKLLVTVHSSDEEAALLWTKIAGLCDSKIIRIPTNDNFWSMGDTGPCGPCSEIFYDHGSSIPGAPPGSADDNGDRFIEIWNLVFMQFETTADGTRVFLPSPSIDTGMGLERIAAVLQGMHNNYDIDLFANIIGSIKDVTGIDNTAMRSHYNVIADHMRAISFMIADGITPSNEGRGYVLRRIVRRALRHGYMMNVHEPFLYRLVPSVGKAMGSYYGELTDRESLIIQILKGEEENFIRTIEHGMAILQAELRRLGSATIFPADVAFKLYDTYGFPFDLTQDILRGEGKKVDEVAFNEIADTQKKASKKAWVGTGDLSTDKVWFDIARDVGSTEFDRDAHSIDTEIVAIVLNTVSVKSVTPCSEAFIVTAKTPFYAESGGQVGDTGTISSSRVLYTQFVEGLVVHKCEVTETLNVGDIVTLRIDSSRRLACARNHTATHILQAALRNILGTHVAQKGSLVTPERLRFDFIHDGAIQKHELEEVEKAVRSVIDSAMNVETKVMPIEEAKASGATALFGEKYTDIVRVVSIGDCFSKELCGGTHVSNTGQIGIFKIISASSIGSGIKRIEAITSHALVAFLEKQIARDAEKIVAQATTIRNLEKQVLEARTSGDIANVKIKSKRIEEVTFKHAICKDIDHRVILKIVDDHKGADDMLCLMLANESSKSGKVAMSIFLSERLIHTSKGNEIVTRFNSILGEQKIKLGVKAKLTQLGGLSIDQAKAVCYVFA